MSKPKNRVFCNLAGRPKMLFETREKAERFLKFNAQSTENWREHKVPIRAYYCSGCMGWHLTSHQTYYRTVKDDEQFISEVISSYQNQLKTKTYQELTDPTLKSIKTLNEKLNYILFKIGGKRYVRLTVGDLDEIKEEIIGLESDFKKLMIENKKTRKAFNKSLHIAKEKLKVGYISKEVEKLITKEIKGKEEKEEKLKEIELMMNDCDETTSKNFLKSIKNEIRIFKRKEREKEGATL